jgi:NAD(P)-dependent dehydrogenase (short-subunit alcohol dehydrogenase family)
MNLCRHRDDEILPWDWSRLFEVNILSGVRLRRHYLETMLAKKRGACGLHPERGLDQPFTRDTPLQRHEDHAALSVSRSLAELTKGTAVTVNTVMAGSTKTESSSSSRISSRACPSKKRKGASCRRTAPR